MPAVAQHFQFYACVFSESCLGGATQSNVTRFGTSIACGGLLRRSRAV